MPWALRLLLLVLLLVLVLLSVVACVVWGFGLGWVGGWEKSANEQCIPGNRATCNLAVHAGGFAD